MSSNATHSQDKRAGQALVVFALMLLGLVAMLALVLDGGNIYLQRRRMQNAADAGAIAGVRVLALNGTEAQASVAAQEYAVQRNHAQSAQVSFSPHQIVVVTEERSAATFARMLGVQTLTVTARATARYDGVTALDGLAPITVRNFDYQHGVPYTIWDDDKDSSPSTGNISGGYRGWLNLDCVYPVSCGDAGSSNLTEWMSNGYPGTLSTNTWIRGSSGAKPSVIHQVTVGQILRIAIFDDIQPKYESKLYYHIVRIAAFKVTKVYAAGNPKGIQGTFEYYVVSGRPDGGPDAGLRAFSLTR
jgi:hypothetical protein